MSCGKIRQEVSKQDEQRRHEKNKREMMAGVMQRNHDSSGRRFKMLKYQWERVSSKREGWLGKQTTKRMRFLK